MRKIDNLGRIVIPKELRKKYGLGEGVDISFEDLGDGIKVCPSDGSCVLCHSSLRDKSKMHLCDACIERILKEYGQ